MSRFSSSDANDEVRASPVCSADSMSDAFATFGSPCKMSPAPPPGQPTEHASAEPQQAT